MKTEKEIIEWRRKYGRASFIGNTLEQNSEIRRSLIKAVGLLHDMKCGFDILSWEDQKVLDILEEILYPKSRHEFDWDETTYESKGLRDPDNIGIDIVVYDSYGRDLD